MGLVRQVCSMCLFPHPDLTRLTDNLFYDVYTHVAEVHLDGFSVDLQWSDIPVEVGKEAERWGKSREYFKCPVYRLPIGRLKASTTTAV